MSNLLQTMIDVEWMCEQDSEPEQVGLFALEFGTDPIEITPRTIRTMADIRMDIVWMADHLLKDDASLEYDKVVRDIYKAAKRAESTAHFTYNKLSIIEKIRSDYNNTITEALIRIMFRDEDAIKGEGDAAH